MQDSLAKEEARHRPRTPPSWPSATRKGALTPDFRAAKFTSDAKLALTNADLPTKTEVEGIVGEIRIDTLDDLKRPVRQHLVFQSSSGSVISRKSVMFWLTDVWNPSMFADTIVPKMFSVTPK